MEKVTDQGDGGHNGPEGWPRPCQEKLSLSQRSEEAVCPVISVYPDVLSIHLDIQIL